MTNDTTTVFEIRDLDLPDRPALAYTLDYDQALQKLERLHQQFQDQLHANGEGGTNIHQRLIINEWVDGGAPQLRFISSVAGGPESDVRRVLAVPTPAVEGPRPPDWRGGGP